MMLCTFGADDDRWSTMLQWPFDGISMPCDNFLWNSSKHNQPKIQSVGSRMQTDVP